MAPQNKLTIVITALASIATALATAVNDVGYPRTIGAVGALFGFVYVLRTYLQGVQMFEERTQIGVPPEELEPGEAEEKEHIPTMPPGMANDEGQ